MERSIKEGERHGDGVHEGAQFFQNIRLEIDDDMPARGQSSGNLQKLVLGRVIDQAFEEIEADAAYPAFMQGGEVRVNPLRPLIADLDSLPLPKRDHFYRAGAFKTMLHVLTARGCPFSCSFCTVINVQGRVMRVRGVECILATIRENYQRHRISAYFFTDDNFCRHKHWEAILEARQLGCRLYDFGGINGKTYQHQSWVGMTKFKTGFAPAQAPTEYVGSFEAVINPLVFAGYRFIKQIRG